MRLVALAGGTGAAKLLRGLDALVEPDWLEKHLDPGFTLTSSTGKVMLLFGPPLFSQNSEKSFTLNSA